MRKVNKKFSRPWNPDFDNQDLSYLPKAGMKSRFR